MILPFFKRSKPKAAASRKTGALKHRHHDFTTEQLRRIQTLAQERLHLAEDIATRSFSRDVPDTRAS